MSRLSLPHLDERGHGVDAEDARNRKDVIDAHSTLVHENARDLGLRHARAARNLASRVLPLCR